MGRVTNTDPGSLFTDWGSISLAYKQDVIFRSLSKFETQATLFKVSADETFNSLVFGFLEGGEVYRYGVTLRCHLAQTWGWFLRLYLMGLYYPSVTFIQLYLSSVVLFPNTSCCFVKGRDILPELTQQPPSAWDHSGLKMCGPSWNELHEQINSVSKT